MIHSLRKTGAMPVTTASTFTKIGAKLVTSALLASLLAAIWIFAASVASADDPVALSITIKDHKFDPAELHAPAGVQIAIRDNEINDTIGGVESSDVYFEKIAH